MNFMRGTLAPEMKKGPISFSADTYGFGQVFFEKIIGKDLIQFYGNDFMNLQASVMALKPSDRPTMAQVAAALETIMRDDETEL